MRSQVRRKFLEQSIAGLAAGSLLNANAQEARPPAVIEAYTNRMSCQPGETLALHVSTDATHYAIDIARIGARREVVWSRADLPGAKHATPAQASMRGCGWPVSVQVPIARDWRSGIYSIRLRGQGGPAVPPNETFFIVRPAEGRNQAKILFQVATNTYQAYNAWGGISLYSGPRSPRVSFDRPFAIFETPPRSGVDWHNPNTNCYHTWDEPFIAWAERAGYAIDYCANLDLEQHPDLLARYKLVLSVGHDEYWSSGMRDGLERYVGNGGNAAFFSGNSVCWHTRVEDQGRALVCYKRSHEMDPAWNADRRQLTTLWSDPILRRPENSLTGVGFAYGGYNRFFGEFMQGEGAGEYTVYRPEHWVFAGTGLGRGERFGAASGIAGYECDGCEFDMVDGRPIPTGRDGTPRGFEILAVAPARWSRRDGSFDWAQALRRGLPAAANAPENALERNGSAVVGLYTRGGTVITVGSTDWSAGLQGGDRVVDRIVRNILDRLSV